jgi:3-phosphoinositide dependent protein kinase-1
MRLGPSPAMTSANSNPMRSSQPRLITELPPPSQLDIEWSPVLTRNNERILKLGNLMVTSQPAPHSPSSKNGDAPTESKKFSRFFGGNTTKKRQRLVMITSSARIVVVPAGGEEKKPKLEISLLANGVSWKTYKDSKGLTAFSVDTREKHFTFEDPKATTSDPEGSRYSSQEWLDTIERAKDLALSQNIAHSYSGDSAFNELSSTISSPTSTLNGLAASSSAGGEVDGVNIPRNPRGREDSDSVKGIKRFSRRHSKNGLAAVF